jgi:hypothetical protein
MMDVLARRFGVALLIGASGLWVLGCDEGSGGGGGGGGDDDDAASSLPDTDGDGLADSFEEEVGTDPEADDSDGDGFLDGDEWSEFSDPMNEFDFAYEGGYGHFPFPEDLAGEGTAVGDVMSDFTLVDAYGQEVQAYTFYGNVIHVFAAADW